MSRPVPLRPSAGADVLTLTSALARAGWGEAFALPLFRGARVMLRELAAAMFEARQGRRATRTGGCASPWRPWRAWA